MVLDVDKMNQNWSISENVCINFKDVEVWFIASIFFLIVDLDSKIKSVCKLQTNKKYFFFGRRVPGLKGWLEPSPPGKIRLMCFFFIYF